MITNSENSKTEILPKAPKPRSVLLSRPHEILEDGIESVESLWKTYKQITKTKGGGKSTNQEQDLLRAMLIFAGACLDACCKSVIKSAWKVLIEGNEKSFKAAASIIDRNLALQSSAEENKRRMFTLGAVLLSPDHRERLIDAVIDDYVKGSLQSTSEIAKIFSLNGK